MKDAVNRAAWLTGSGHALTISAAAMQIPGDGELLVRTRALGLNPFDRVVQTLGSMVTPWLRYPAVLGSDVAGEVVGVGPSVTRFQVGDRVLGLALGIDKFVNRAAEGAFQDYVILRQDAATALPDALGFEAAAVCRWASPPPPVACSWRTNSACVRRPCLRRRPPARPC